MVDKQKILRVSDLEEEDCKVSEQPSCHLNKKYYFILRNSCTDSATKRNANKCR